MRGEGRGSARSLGGAALGQELSHRHVVVQAAGAIHPRISPQIDARVRTVKQRRVRLPLVRGVPQRHSVVFVGSVVMNQRTFDGSKKVVPFAPAGASDIMARNMLEPDTAERIDAFIEKRAPRLS